MPANTVFAFADHEGRYASTYAQTNPLNELIHILPGA